MNTPEWVTIVIQAFSSGAEIIANLWAATLGPMVAAAPPTLGWAVAGVLLIALVLKK